MWLCLATIDIVLQSIWDILMLLHTLEIFIFDGSFRVSIVIDLEGPEDLGIILAVLWQSGSQSGYLLKSDIILCAIIMNIQHHDIF